MCVCWSFSCRNYVVCYLFGLGINPVLSEIAAGMEVTAEQRERGVATVDGTDDDLAGAVRDAEAELPCSADAAAAVVRAYTAGASVGDAAGEAGAVQTCQPLPLDPIKNATDVSRN